MALDLFRFHIDVWNPSEIVVIITDSSPSVLVNYSDSQIFSNWILQWLRYFGPNILFFYFFRSQKPKKKKRQQTKARPLSLCCCSHWRWFHYRRWCCAAVFSLLLNACVRLSACFFFLLCNIKHRNLREAADSTSSKYEVGSHLSVTHPWRGDQIRQRRDIIFFFFLNSISELQKCVHTALFSTWELGSLCWQRRSTSNSSLILFVEKSRL